MSRSRDIASILGATEAENTTNVSLGAGGGGGSGVTNADSIGLFAAAPDSGTLHYAKDTKALYLFDGSEYDRVFSGPNESLTFDSSIPASTIKSVGDSAFTLRISAKPDAEGFPITYSFATVPANPIEFDSSYQVRDSSTADAGIFHIKPTTKNHFGDVTFRGIATDGTHKISSSGIITIADGWAGSWNAVDFTSGAIETYGTATSNIASNVRTGSTYTEEGGFYHLPGSTSNYYAMDGAEAKILNQNFTLIMHWKDGKVHASSTDFRHTFTPNRHLFDWNGGSVLVREEGGSDANTVYLTSSGATNNSQTTLHNQGSTGGWGAVLVVRGNVDGFFELAEFNALTGALVDESYTSADTNFAAGGYAGPLGNDTGHLFFGTATTKGGYGADTGGGAVRQVALYETRLSNAEITTAIINNISTKVA